MSKAKPTASGGAWHTLASTSIVGVLLAAGLYRVCRPEDFDDSVTETPLYPTATMRVPTSEPTCGRSGHGGCCGRSQSNKKTNSKTV